MFRAVVFLTALLMTGPVLAGPAWLCLCMESVASSCCCPHEDHGGNTLEAGCCCAISPQDAHAPTSPAGAAEQAPMVPQLPPPGRMDDVRALSVEQWNLDQPFQNTGPPPGPALPSSIRLRP